MDNTPAPTGLANQVAALSDALERQRVEFQEAEKSLVTRIADVDDDRRLTTNRLQRAWQTHHEDTDARLKHQTSRFIGWLLLLALLFGIAFAFAYGQLNAAHRALLAEQGQLRMEYEQLAAASSRETSTQETSTQESLDDLSKRVEALAKSFADGATPAEAPGPTPGPVSDQVPEQTFDRVPDQVSGQLPDQSPTAVVASDDAVPDATASKEFVAETQSNAPPSTEPGTEPDAEPGAAEATEAQVAAMAQTVTPVAAVDPTQSNTDASAPPETIVQEAQPESMPEPISESLPEPTSAPPAPQTQGDPSGIDQTPAETSEPEPESAPESVAADTDAESAAPDSTAAKRALPPEVTIDEKPKIVGETPFALQLIGFYSLDDLMNFARREQLPSRVYYREESYQGRPWFVLIHSLHSKQSGASEAMAQLPKELAMLDTFIRSFSPETELGVLEIER